MAASVYRRQHMTWLGETSLSWFAIFIDTASDLPNDPYYFSTDTDKYKIAQGSLAYDISTTDMYMFNSSNAWVKQGG